ncbi:hypothetical protein D3C85_1861570 [compost metagenome]
MVGKRGFTIRSTHSPEAIAHEIGIEDLRDLRLVLDQKDETLVDHLQTPRA